MRFCDPTQVQQLLLDDHTSGFFDRAKNSDYAFYQEKDGGWFPTRSVWGLFSKRYKALRYRGVLAIELEPKDILLSNRVQAAGQITIDYQMGQADRIVFMDSTDLANELLGRVKRVLSLYLSRLASNELGRDKSWIIETANKQFLQEADRCGYTLTIVAFEPVTSHDTITEDETGKDIAHASNLERRRKEMLLEGERTRVQILLDVERFKLMAIAEAEKAYMMLGVRRQELEGEAEHLRRVRMFDVDVARMMDDLFLGKVSRIAQLPPELIAAAIALADPQPGSAMAEMMRARVAATAQGDAMSLMHTLITNKPGGQQPFAASGGTFLPTLTLPVVVSDPVLNQLTDAGYKATLDRNDYLITLANLGSSNYYVRLQMTGKQVATISHGHQYATQTRWTGAIIRDDPVAAVNLVVQELSKRR